MRQLPFVCSCGHISGAKTSDLAAKPAKAEGARKASICRSNRCGHYNADRDACQLLIDKGRAGRVTYLLTHPATKCVADEPLF